ncbi:MAG TPA: isoprenylcysteine carboxylmethyltransferase family protein [Vicinamibacterales bacterium]|nr:isoprenylcysteine carboxylmethyltransferase family protein [Vicinamibacterales bacterium]
MSFHDPYLLVRATSLYLPLALLAIAWVWRRPGKRSVAGAALAFFWNLPTVLLLDVVARRLDWWRFDAQGGLLLGTPVDLWLAWACLWGAVPAISFSRLPLGVVAAVAFAVDLVSMPHGAPVIRLGSRWLVGEVLGLIVGLVPSQLLARWTARDDHLEARALLQAGAFTGLFVFVLPAIIIEATGATSQTFNHSAWEIGLVAQMLAAPALIGITAVQEFATRGHGTPVPFDPPRQLVTTGVYAYVRNPMQLSGVLMMLVLGVVLRSGWIAAAGVMAHFYAVGFAGWDEDDDLRCRFGDAWDDYRRAVRSWIPRFRPWGQPDALPARLFVSESCDMCRDVGRWFAQRHATHLTIVAAETHSSGALTRITYESNDGSFAASGIEAIGRALEHIHLGWALVGFLLRAPGVKQLAQLLADACGAGPRTIPRRAVIGSGGTDTERQRPRLERLSVPPHNPLA